ITNSTPKDGGLDSPGCTAIFLLHYTSGMASSLWWLLLSLAWYLAAGCKWGHEAIAACSTYFHLLAWGLPALLSCLALALGHVSGDELTGLCRVAGAPAPSRMAAILSVAPLALCLVLGSSLIAAGFVSLFRIRRAVRASGRATAPLDKLMARLGVYAFLHTLPATGLLTCAAYEVILGTSWAQRAATEPCNDNDCSLEHSIPHLEAFLLKSVLELGVGVTSGVWVWSSKTLLAWGRLCTRCCGLTRPAQGKVVDGPKGRNGSTAESAIWLDSDRAGFA
uniref:frizzled-9-like n=1 Tax=Myxine glutinosa TaxID=7769 RepID=UPI00358F94BE